MIGGLSYDELEMAMNLADDERLHVELERDEAHLRYEAEKAAGNALADVVRDVCERNLKDCSLGRVKVAYWKLGAALEEFNG